jgi:hypothetical protein
LTFDNQPSVNLSGLGGPERLQICIKRGPTDNFKISLRLSIFN